MEPRPLNTKIVYVNHLPEYCPVMSRTSPSDNSQRGIRTSEVYCAGAYHPESIDTIWDDHKMDKWTNGQNLRGSQCKCNDIN